MRYLITYIEEGKIKGFYSWYFEPENDFNPEVGTVVFDLLEEKVMRTEGVWEETPQNTL